MVATPPRLLRPAVALTDRLRARSRLLGLVALLLLPTLFATWSFTGVLGEQVAFADAERSGVTVVRPAVLALADVAAGRAVDLAPVTAAVRAQPQLAADDALRTAAAAAADDPAGRAQTAEALAALVTAVADSSKLILDPDLDSFYVMDALVVQLPRGLVVAAQSAADAPGASGSARTAARAVLSGTLAGAAASVSSDVSTAARATSRAALPDELAGTQDAVDRLGELADALRADVDPAAADAARADEGRAREAAGLAAARAVGPLAATLDALLESRRDALVDRRDRALLVTLAGLALAAWLAAAVIWRTDSDVARTVVAAEAIGAGDLQPHPLPSGTDEYGDIGRALGGARERLQQLMGGIAQSSTALRAASAELADVSEHMGRTAADAAAEARTVAGSAGEVSSGVQTVSHGTDELAAAVQDIAASASAAARVAADAVAMAESADESLGKLGTSSEEISGVLRLISSIAAQTNLLALNATIEAARAGEYGKGFAVVAQEVKELAQQTASATDEVGQKVAALQSDAAGAIVALQRMQAVTSQISDHQATIAAAVEEQTATTAEMTRSLSSAAQGSRTIADTASGVARAAQATTEGAARTRQAADAVSRAGRTIDEQLSTFSC